MRLTVEPLTFDDFKEAAAAVREAQAKRKQREVRRSRAMWLWTVAIAAVLFCVTMWGFPLPTDPLSDQHPPMYTLIAFVVPLACIAVLALTIAAAQVSASRARMTGKLLLSLLPLALLLAMLALLWLLTQVAPPATPASGPRDWYGTFLPHAGWVLITALFTVVVTRATKSQLREAWQAQPSVSRTKVFDITASGVTIDETVTRRTYTWLGFVRFLETPNLLILCPSDLTFEMLPKRAFASAADLDAVRALFAAEIRVAGEQPAAFPVLPAAAAAR